MSHAVVPGPWGGMTRGLPGSAAARPMRPAYLGPRTVRAPKSLRKTPRHGAVGPSRRSGMGQRNAAGAPSPGAHGDGTAFRHETSRRERDRATHGQNYSRRAPGRSGRMSHAEVPGPWGGMTRGLPGSAAARPMRPAYLGPRTVRAPKSLRKTPRHGAVGPSRRSEVGQCCTAGELSRDGNTDDAAFRHETSRRAPGYSDAGTQLFLPCAGAERRTEATPPVVRLGTATHGHNASRRAQGRSGESARRLPPCVVARERSAPCPQAPPSSQGDAQRASATSRPCARPE